jgi:Tfp pilus assembly protein PilX
MLKNIARLLRSERGVALPVAVSVLMVSGALAGAAATSAVTGDRQSNRDRSVKRAVAAADAGLNIASYRLNHFATALTPTLQCVSLNASSGLLQVEAALGDNWCRAQTEDLGEGTSYSYRVSTRAQVNIGGQAVWQRKIVSTGIANGVQRRAITSVAAPTGTPMFIDAVYSELDLLMRNSALVNGTVRSNGNVVLQNGAKVCGDVQVGPKKQLRGSKPTCGGTDTVATEPFVLNPVAVPATNDNGRLSSGADPKTGGISWNATTRVLTGNGGSVTLRGSTYVFCSIHLTNGALIIIEDDGTPVRIFIDAPENCTTGDPARGSVMFEKKGRTDTLGPPALAQIYMIGSKTIPTSFAFDNNEKDCVEMVLYAPNSTFTIQNNGCLLGAVVAKQVSLSNNAEINYDASAGTVMVEDVPLQIYKRQAWVECTPTQKGTAPDGGC